jgi:putative NADH-flavin reductase
MEHHMKLTVLGGTGATGQLVTDSALAAGHEVTLVVRQATQLPDRPGATYVEGDVRDAGLLASATRDRDVLISTLGIGGAKSHDDLILDTSRAIVEGLGSSGMSRVVMMSAFGVGTSLAKASRVLRLLYRGGRETFADKAAGEELLTGASLDWTLVYPVLLTNKASSGRLNAVDLEKVERVPGVPRVSRADVADFLLRTATDGTWSRRTVVVTSAS